MASFEDKITNTTDRFGGTNVNTLKFGDIVINDTSGYGGVSYFFSRLDEVPTATDFDNDTVPTATSFVDEVVNFIET